MGLLSKVKSGLGQIKNKSATALGGIYRGSGTAGKLARRVAGSAIVKGGAKVALTGAKFAGKALFGSKIRAGLTIATLGIAGIRKLKGRGAQQQVAAGAAGEKSSLKSKILKGVGIAAGVGAAGYVAEQVAEKLGVRGGAGFIGRRKKKSGKRRKSRGRRRAGRRGRRRGRRIIRGRGLGRGEIRHSGKGTKSKVVSFTTKDGKRVRFRVKR